MTIRRAKRGLTGNYTFTVLLTEVLKVKLMIFVEKSFIFRDALNENESHK
jgi:hypothetical protein